VAALLKRLTNQLRSKGVKGAKNMAAALLTKRGQMKNGKLTEEGKKRQKLGNAGRAKARAAKYSGNKSSDYNYNPKTNRTKLKK
jgi:hypothetical protein